MVHLRELDEGLPNSLIKLCAVCWNHGQADEGCCLLLGSDEYAKQEDETQPGTEGTNPNETNVPLTVFRLKDVPPPLLKDVPPPLLKDVTRTLQY